MEISFVVVVSILLSIIYLLSPFGGRDARQLPPSPWGLPLIGHLHMLGSLPHRTLQRLATTYGPIMSIRLGLTPVIVVSSPEAAELFLKTHDAVFASRPDAQVAEYISYGQKNMTFAKYGPYWRNVRKLCTIELLSSAKIEAYKHMRREELLSFVESIKETRTSVDISLKVELLVSSPDSVYMGPTSFSTLTWIGSHYFMFC